MHEPWRVAEPLVGAGVDRDWVDLVAGAAGPATDAAIAWVAATLTARGLAAELKESTQRMSGLVGAVKTYAYMDRGELLELDIHEGLETTIAVLGHRLKQTSIEVMRNYDKSLPKLTVRGVGAQPGLDQPDRQRDRRARRSRHDHDHDRAARRAAPASTCPTTAPAFPTDIRERVFDSFFTTKDVGHGTGLGLATAHRIVVDRHQGTLSLDSGPDGTTFHVWLPRNQS